MARRARGAATGCVAAAIFISHPLASAAMPIVAMPAPTPALAVCAALAPAPVALRSPPRRRRHHRGRHRANPDAKHERRRPRLPEPIPHWHVLQIRDGEDLQQHRELARFSPPFRLFRFHALGRLGSVRVVVAAVERDGEHNSFPKTSPRMYLLHTFSTPVPARHKAFT